MGKPLEKRFKEEGIDPKEIIREINQRGLEPVSRERGCGIEAITKYAKDVLHIENAPLFNRNYLKDNHDLARELISALFTKWQEIKTENDQLRVELAKQRQLEAHKDAMAKSQLMEMLNAVRS